MEEREWLNYVLEKKITQDEINSALSRNLLSYYQCAFSVAKVVFFI